jgi:hypothetical protein
MCDILSFRTSNVDRARTAPKILNSTQSTVCLFVCLYLCHWHAKRSASTFIVSVIKHFGFQRFLNPRKPHKTGKNQKTLETSKPMPGFQETSQINLNDLKVSGFPGSPVSRNSGNRKNRKLNCQIADAIR